MDERILTTEEKRLLEDESENSKQSRQRSIKNGLIIVSVSLAVTFLTSMVDRSSLSHQFGRILGAVTAISYCACLMGLFHLYFWFRAAKKAIDKLDKDILAGKKVSALLKITGYNFVSREIKLDNGLNIERYHVGDKWKKGDSLDIEYLPNSAYILKCDKKVR